MKEKKSGFCSPAIEERRKRMANCLTILRSLGTVEEKKAVAILSMNYSITSRKSKEYIDTFVNFGSAERTKDDSKTFITVVGEVNAAV